MNKTNLHSIDLNLVVVLAALLEEGSVTRAALRLGRTQSAVSHALGRLRTLFGDPLFVRSPEGMTPTPYALSLSKSVNDILGRMELLFGAGRVFDPSRDRRCFMVGFSDYTSFVFLPRLAARLARIAPNVELVAKYTSFTLGVGMLESGEAEIVVGNLPATLPNFIREQVLFLEEYVCAMPKTHPAARKGLTLEQFLESKHILVSLQGKMLGYLDRAIQKLGLVRKTQIIIGYFLLAPFMLLDNNAIVTEPSRMIIPLAKILGLKVSKPPFEIDPMPIKMAWHHRYDNDNGHKWMRELIAELAE
ncbi:MAG: LysR family transcriptional regulator [Planctomycetota bacterium]|jgi:DNA-binding transcriptional LysR family regulator|nr:LysR family transcriptional regulator [Planctomycetota bacterium]